eukprot:343307-Pleurochrysis_carterae.AAC.2
MAHCCATWVAATATAAATAAAVAAVSASADVVTTTSAAAALCVRNEKPHVIRALAAETLMLAHAQQARETDRRTAALRALCAAAMRRAAGRHARTASQALPADVSAI